MKTSTNCPACTGRISLWHGFRAATPFRITCPHCRARLGITMRWLAPVFWLVMTGGLALGIYIGYLAAHDRFLPVLYISVGVVIAWIVAELVGGTILFTYAKFKVLTTSRDEKHSA